MEQVVLLDSDAWADAMAEVTAMGVTHRHYGDPEDTDTRLWNRVRTAYNLNVRRYRASGNKPLTVERRSAELPAEPMVSLAETIRQAYNTDAGRPYIDLERLADAVRQRTGAEAYVEQTGGGCATLYAGPQWTDEHGDQRYSVVVGPGWFDGPGWRHGYASYEECHVSRDDDVTPGFEMPKGASIDQMADLITAEVSRSKAHAARDEKLREAQREALQWETRVASQRLSWERPLTDDECEALMGVDIEVGGGESDWRVAVLVYQLAEPLTVEGGAALQPGTYIRMVEDKRVLGYRVDDLERAAAYADAVNAEWEHENPHHTS